MNEYGINHPRLATPFAVTSRHQAELIAEISPGATVVTRERVLRPGVRGTRRGWSSWTPLFTETNRNDPMERPEPWRRRNRPTPRRQRR